MTLILRTFGPIELVTVTGERVPGAGVQPKPLLILALAALTPGGVARDRLLRAIWPGVERERARASLKQHLYALRRATGLSTITAGGGRVAVPPGALRVDALEFNELVDAGRLIEAGQLLRGELLDGIEMEGKAGAELERLLTEVRERWARRVSLVRAHGPSLDATPERRDSSSVLQDAQTIAAEREVQAAVRRTGHGLITLPADEIAVIHRVIWCMHDLFEALAAAVATGINEGRIAEMVSPVRALWQRSEVLRRLLDERRPLRLAEHEWLLSGVSTAADPVGRALERYLQRSSVGVALRDLQLRQEAALAGLLQAGREGARVLVLGTLSLDRVAELLPGLRRTGTRLVYAPDDPAALAVARLRLESLGADLVCIEGDRIARLEVIQEQAPFDLMLCGDLLDALTARNAAWMLRHLVAMLAPQGELLLAAEHHAAPMGPWYRWILRSGSIPRDRDDLLALVGDAPVRTACVVAPTGEQWWLRVTRGAASPEA